MITTALHYYSAQFQAMPGVVEHPEQGLLTKCLLGEGGGRCASGSTDVSV